MNGSKTLPQRPATRRDFEIAIVCALVHEADAVETLFDHHWEDDGPPYDKATGDPNSYSTGAIGRHNVVLVHMPGVGKINAATVSADCRTSFPNIRLALVVGVCGVFPISREGQEIILGDVIISDGVVQYDLGRRLPGRFARKDTLIDSLGRPNPEMRSLLAKLKTLHSRKILQDKSYRYLAAIQQRQPKLSAHYPGAGHDKLFDAAYQHVTDGELCDECGCSGQLLRRSRLNGDSEPQPVVHFGHIASGDSVIKSGEDRDIIAHRDMVIAFEMESAGVWDIFPCVVIKGACDYADSHKTKTWQHYAAATAAACMKALLDSWVPAQLSVPEPQAVPKNNVELSSRVIMLPFRRNLKFTGREAILEELEQRLFVLHDCRTLAITGLGGVGKTQVALQFAYWVKDHQPDYSVFWVPAYSEEVFEQAYLEIATDLRISIKADDKNPKSAVRNYLSSPAAGKWVLIVDNADDAEMVLTSSRRLRRYFPESESGLTILTTRSPDVAVAVAEGNEVHLQGMAVQDATNLLRNSLSRKSLLHDAQMTAMLLGELTCLPLAITQAAAYLNRNRHVSLRGYLELLRGTKQDITTLLTSEFEDTTRYRGSHNAVATTWIVSFNQLQEIDPEAASLLSFISCIEPKDIPRSILPPSQSNEILEHTIGTLCGYSFLVHQETSGMFDMHRLVHIATNVWLSKQGRTVVAAIAAIRRLGELFSQWRTRDRRVWRTYYPHAFRLLDRSEEYALDERYDLCFKVGRSLYLDRRFENAVLYFETVSRWRARHLHNADEKRLKADHCLGTAYLEMYRIPEAIQILERVVDISRRTLDETNKNRLASEHELARAYFAGRIQEAIKILEHTVSVERRILPDWDGDLLASQHELARAYLEDERTQAAIKMLKHVARVKQRTLEETNRDRLATDYWLATAYLKDSQVRKAIDLFEYVLRRCRTSLDEEDPDLLASERQLARAYLRDRQASKAVDLLRHVVAVESQSLDTHHPDRQASLVLLGDAYQRLAEGQGTGNYEPR
ncbi:hypothetical protein PG997_015434 [Apiospora hydei]|uniref:Nucleoside phosphorylase domain-containing protein n=1 Tax=Apiospora hydei TaxID=1337664 RepID=A0ABR1UQL2_9PEZI